MSILEDDRGVHDGSGRPCPAVRDYPAELASLTDAGWEVHFSRPRAGEVCELRGRHRGLTMVFIAGLPQACREQPGKIRRWVRCVAEDVLREVQQKPKVDPPR